MLIIIPALASSTNDLASMLGFALLKATVVLGALLLFGQRLMRPWFHLVARQKSSELFMLNVLLITLDWPISPSWPACRWHWARLWQAS